MRCFLSVLAIGLLLVGQSPEALGQVIYRSPIRVLPPAPQKVQPTSVAKSAPKFPLPKITNIPSSPYEAYGSTNQAFALERAVLIHTTMSQNEVQMTAILKTISQNVPKIPEEKLGTSMQEMEAMVLDLQTSASKVISGFEQYKLAIESYRRSVSLAPEAYKKASDFCHAKSVDPNIPEFLRKKYGQLSQDCLACVKLVRERHEIFDGSTKEIADTVANVKHTSAFLNDYLNFLKLYPGRDSSKERAEFIDELRSFIRNFKTFEKRFQDISDQLREKAVPKEVKLAVAG